MLAHVELLNKDPCLRKSAGQRVPWTVHTVTLAVGFPGPTNSPYGNLSVLLSPWGGACMESEEFDALVSDVDIAAWVAAFVSLNYFPELFP